MALAHEKVGHTEQGLWHHKGMQLPAYVQHVANDLIAAGHDESQAIQLAIGIIKNWAAGHDGKGGKVSAETQAKAAAALAEWEALKAKAGAGKDHGRQEHVTPYTRSFPLEDISIRAGGDGRTVDAYAAVFDVPAEVHDQDGHYEEILDPTVFNRAIEHARRAKGGWSIPVMYNHGMTIWQTPSERHSVPIGTPEDIRVDGRGLFTRSRFHRTQLADEILEAIRDGSIDGYSFQGAFRRSDPVVPRGGFRPERDGKLPTVRRTESSLREFGPCAFRVYADAAVVGVRAEQAAFLLSTLDPGERERLAVMLRTGTPLDSPAAGTPDSSGPAAEDPPPEVRHSGRPLSPHEELARARARFLIKHGGGRIGA